MKQPLRPKFHIKIFFSLLGLELIFILLHLFFQRAGSTWNHAFNLDQEANAPTWFAAALLLSVALCAFALYRTQEPARSGGCFSRLFWLGFSLVCVLFSLDEVAGFHEMSVRWVGPVRFALFGLVAGVFFGASVYYFLVLRREARHLAAWILPGLGIFFLGAIGLETANNLLAPQNANLISLRIIAEEGMELMGAIMVLTGCLAELSRLEAGRLDQIFAKQKMPRPCLIRGAAFSLMALVLAGLAGLAVARSASWSTIPRLQHEVENARKNKLYGRALELDRILLQRYIRQGKQEDIFDLRLEVASLEHRLGNREGAHGMLRALQQNHQKDLQKTARIALAQSHFYKEEGNLTEALSLLIGVRTDGLLPGIHFNVAMSLAGLYVDAGQWTEAERLYDEMAEMFAGSSLRRSSACSALARLYLRRGEIERASESLSLVSPLFLDQDLYFHVQNQLAVRYLQGKRYEEAMAVYESLAARLNGNPRHIFQVKDQLRILRRKLKEQKKE